MVIAAQVFSEVNKKYFALFRKADDELHIVLNIEQAIQDAEPTARVQYADHIYYPVKADTFEEVMQGRKKNNPLKGPDWEEEWDNLPDD